MGKLTKAQEQREGVAAAWLGWRIHDSDGPATFGVWKDALVRADRVLAILARPDAEPVAMVLHCPACGLQHIDEADTDASAHPDGRETRWDNPPHRSHLCHGCGHIWRPADIATTGVQAVLTAGTADSPIVAPAPSALIKAGEVSEEMVGRAALALQKLRLERLQKLWDTKGASLMTDEPSGMRDDARAALTAALKGGSDVG